MKTTYSKFLIISTIVLFIGGVYLYFSNKLNSESVIPVAYGSSLVSSNVVDTSSTPVSPSGKIADDISFLTTLVSLKKITLDTSLFSNNSFKILQDNSVKLELVVPGRTNPFAPINSSDISLITTVPKVVTDQPTQITDKTAVLNGTVNVTSGVTDTYFEYGTIESLGTTTTIVKPSLVGAFIKSVLGLTPKTNYFYKACAKINSVALCGDVVPFTTN